MLQYLTKLSETAHKIINSQLQDSDIIDSLKIEYRDLNDFTKI